MNKHDPSLWYNQTSWLSWMVFSYKEWDWFSFGEEYTCTRFQHPPSSSFPYPCSFCEGVAEITGVVIGESEFSFKYIIICDSCATKLLPESFDYTPYHNSKCSCKNSSTILVFYIFINYIL